MKREMKGSLLAREMGDEVLGSIPGFSPWMHTVALLDNKTGVEGWSPSPKIYFLSFSFSFFLPFLFFYFNNSIFYFIL